MLREYRHAERFLRNGHPAEVLNELRRVSECLFPLDPSAGDRLTKQTNCS